MDTEEKPEILRSDPMTSLSEAIPPSFKTAKADALRDAGKSVVTAAKDGYEALEKADSPSKER